MSIQFKCILFLFISILIVALYLKIIVIFQDYNTCLNFFVAQKYASYLIYKTYLPINLKHLSSFYHKKILSQKNPIYAVPSSF